MLWQMFLYRHLSKYSTQISTSGIAGSANLLACFNHNLVWKISTFNCQDLMLCDAMVFWGWSYCYIWGHFWWPSEHCSRFLQCVRRSLLFLILPSASHKFRALSTDCQQSAFNYSSRSLTDLLPGYAGEERLFYLCLKKLPLDLSHTGRKVRFWYSFRLLWPPTSSSSIFMQ